MKFSSQIERSSALPALLKDQLSFSTILLGGATLSSILYHVPLVRLYAREIILALLALKVLERYLSIYGYLKRPRIQSIANTRTTASFEDDPQSDGSVVCFILGAQSHHPLGILAPGFKELGDYADKMYRDLSANAASNGFLGANGYIGRDEASGNELITILYFRTTADIHKFASDALHMEGWNWYNKVAAQYPYIGISHESYESPAGSWEVVYKGYKPHGLSGTMYKTIDQEGNDTFVSACRDATQGRHKTSKGRMGLSDGSENEKMELN